MHLDDTIAAIASAPGGGARGVVRLSGPQVRQCLEQCFATEDSITLKQVRHATVIAGRMQLANFTAPLPVELYYWPTSRSYTRQPTAEIHTLGSPPLLAAVLKTVCAAGARLAGPGEFTLRAFLAGRLDLVQAEAVLGVIDAQDRTQLESALTQLAGGVSHPLHGLRNTLLDLLAHLEAGLDFVEEDIEFISKADLSAQLAAAAESVALLIEQMQSRGTASPAFRVTLVGSPNVGKSSLFNALVARDAALVADEAGTTRDYLSARLQLDGVTCLLVDTAGVDVPSSAITQQAQHLAAEQRTAADVQLFCLDSTRPLTAWEREQLDAQSSAARIVVLTKSDLPRATDYRGPCIATSATTADGLAELKAALSQMAANAAGSVINPGHSVLHWCDSTAERCGESLRFAAESLVRAHGLSAAAGQEDLIAAELRLALDALGQIVGAVYTEDVLDRIFSRFCIGK